MNGDACVTDLAAMPHLLIAGSTGTGKSVGLNCMIASILFRSTPDEVRLILIDPKRLELGVYEDIPHLLTPVVTDPKIASNVLKWAVGEMERRIRKLASEGVRNIEQFNNIIRAEKGERKDEDGEDLKPLHYIVIVIDELADLMMVSSHEVEESITRLAQMARAVGHPPHPRHPAALGGRASPASSRPTSPRASRSGWRPAWTAAPSSTRSGPSSCSAAATCCSCPRAARACSASTAPT